MVHQIEGDDSRFYHIISQNGSPSTTESSLATTSLGKEDAAAMLLGRWQHLGLSHQVTNIISSSWSDETVKSYSGVIKKWLSYCHRVNADPHRSTIELGVNFLMELHNAGLGYSSIGKARSVLSLIINPIDGHDFGSHPLVSRFMKGMFMQRPNLPKHVVSYDPQKVLNFLAGLPSWGTIGLKWLTLKLAAIIALSSGHRGQTICSLSLNHMSINADRGLS